MTETSPMTKHTLLANLHAGIDHLVAEALEAARASGRIAPVTEYAAYRFDIVTAWNQFEEAGLASLSRWDRDSLVGPLKRIFAMKALSDAQKALESEPASPALEARFLAQAETLIATGTAPYGPGVAGEAHTGVVPGRFHVCLEDWVPSIVMDNPDRGIFDRSKPAFITPAGHRRATGSHRSDRPAFGRPSHRGLDPDRGLYPRGRQLRLPDQLRLRADAAHLARDQDA